MKKKLCNNGFTLVELLAVIVILVIAVPGISNMIESSKRSAFEADAKMVLKASELKMLEDKTFDPLIVNE